MAVLAHAHCMRAARATVVKTRSPALIRHSPALPLADLGVRLCDPSLRHVRPQPQDLPHLLHLWLRTSLLSIHLASRQRLAPRQLTAVSPAPLTADSWAHSSHQPSGPAHLAGQAVSRPTRVSLGVGPQRAAPQAYLRVGHNSHRLDKLLSASGTTACGTLANCRGMPAIRSVARPDQNDLDTPRAV